jgi:hypothetical protein
MEEPPAELESLLLARFGPGNWRDEAWRVERVRYRVGQRAALLPDGASPRDSLGRAVWEQALSLLRLRADVVEENLQACPNRCHRAEILEQRGTGRARSGTRRPEVMVERVHGRARGAPLPMISPEMFRERAGGGGETPRRARSRAKSLRHLRVRHRPGLRRLGPSW